jgi:phenylacetate-CoA ligase
MSYAEEMEEQKRWKLLPAKSKVPWFHRLIEDEFLEPERVEDRILSSLKRNLTRATLGSPYYQKNSRDLKISPESMTSHKELSRWPILKRQNILDHAKQLILKKKGGRKGPEYWKSSSGTTGRPVRVLHSTQSLGMFSLHVQRLLRWERWDPSLKLATIRVPDTMPRDRNGNQLSMGQTMISPYWQHLGQFFHTGRHYSFSRLNPESEQLRWLDQHKPEYLITYPGTLESLVLARNGLPTDSLKGARVISAQFTDGMRRRISELTPLAIGQNYGLNEVGIVANRCRSGRYHVNYEHCHVEIVDEHDQPCSPGAQGRLIVTSLQNTAMPLIRYDSTDLARPAEGPCPCGRTSPSFLDIVGRHRSWRDTPDGTPARFNLLHGLIEGMPAHLCLNLHQFQIHQHIGPHYTLRLETRGPMPEEFLEQVRNAWKEQFESLDDLNILEGEEIPPHPSGKQQPFLSDYQQKRQS